MNQSIDYKLINEIRKRISKDIDWVSSLDYHGFRMDKTHSQEEENELITRHNERVIDLFKDYIDSDIIKTCFDCWKGECFIALGKDHNRLIKSFGGWCSEDIIYWLILNGTKESMKKAFDEIDWEEIPSYEETLKEDFNNRKEISRIILSQQRYEVLKRQKWKCNECGIYLKYNNHSNFGEEVAHIDHIFPFSQRKNYFNGEKNINELSNLQALCPKCNLKKGKKQIQ